MKIISEEEIKKINFDLLAKFTDICEENNLRYVLDYGTLLGAIRHKGFIPWDDDVDVSMPREDYEKLYQLSVINPSLFGEHIRLASPRGKNNIFRSYFTLVDTRTITISATRKKKYNVPIWLDIFPMDYSPDSKSEEEKLMKTNEYLIYKTWDALTPLSDKNPITICAKIYHILSLNRNLRKIDKNAQRYKKGNKLNLYTTFSEGMNCEASEDFFEDWSYEQFENRRFRIPKDWDERLRQLYGDYMQIPKEEDCKKHMLRAFWI